MKSKVTLQDVEDYNLKDKTNDKHIDRKLVIPLPRSFDEGNEWSFQ
jgi:hypothetical protein